MLICFGMEHERTRQLGVILCHYNIYETTMKKLTRLMHSFDFNTNESCSGVRTQNLLVSYKRILNKLIE